MAANSTDVFMIERGGTLYKVSLADVEALLVSLGHKKVAVSTTAPASPTIGDLWVDTN